MKTENKALNILMKHNPTFLSSKYSIEYGVTPVVDAMEEYAEELSIWFADFVSQNYQCNIHKEYVKNGEPFTMAIKYSLSDLFTLYLQTIK